MLSRQDQLIKINVLLKDYGINLIYQIKDVFRFNHFISYFLATNYDKFMVKDTDLDKKDSMKEKEEVFKGGRRYKIEY